MSEHEKLAIEIVQMAQQLDDCNEHRYDHNDAVMIATRLIGEAFPAPSAATGETPFDLAAFQKEVETWETVESEADMVLREIANANAQDEEITASEDEFMKELERRRATSPEPDAVRQTLQLPVQADFRCDEDDGRYSVRWINAFRSISLIVNDDGRIVLVESTVSPPRSSVLASTTIAALSEGRP